MELSGRDIAAALSAVIIWGLNFVAMKYGLRDFTPFQLGFFRYIFAVLPLVFFVPKPRLGWTWLVPAGLAQFAQFALMFLALKFDMTAALASVLIQAQIFFTAILGAVLLGERVSPPMRVGFTLAAIGLSFFVLNFVIGADTAGVTVLGLLLSLGSAFAMASSNVLARKAQSVDTDYDPLQFVVWMSLVPIIPFALLAWLCEPAATHWQWTHASLLGWCSAAFLGWLATIAAYGFWTNLLKRHPANLVSPFGLGVPVVGLAAGMLALGEQVTVWQWVGSGFVIAALMTVMSAPRAPASMPEKEPAD
jgi:O-acetylserine/cysteine efflux transporter